MYFFCKLAKKAVLLHRDPDKFVDFDKLSGEIFNNQNLTPMRRIEFIAPVDAMRGNLSGSQNLQYAENNNPAFDAPNGRQYAKNYQTRYIGAKRASDGLKLFAVKTRTATLIDDASLTRMAVLGGAGALYAAVTKNAAVLVQAKGVYGYFKDNFAKGLTFRQWLTRALMDMLKAKTASYVATASYSAGTFNLTIDNPWNKASGEPNCPVSDEVLAKFWMQLAQNAISVVASGITIVGRTGDTLGDIIASNYNVAGLSSVALSPFASNVVKRGDWFLCEDQEGDPGIQTLVDFALVDASTIRHYFSATPGAAQG